MASVSSQPQFRYTQTPSKVLHLRNLPWECTEEELIELGKPFGKVVNTKCNVGANMNQAFIEFAEQNQAIAMISYYASSSEPAQVRGKTVYLQYSNRQEIVNNKTSADVAGNVLLVTIEGNDARLVSIDVLHLIPWEPPKHKGFFESIEEIFLKVWYTMIKFIIGKSCSKKCTGLFYFRCHIHHHKKHHKSHTHKKEKKKNHEHKHTHHHDHDHGHHVKKEKEKHKQQDKNSDEKIHRDKDNKHVSRHDKHHKHKRRNSM